MIIPFGISLKFLWNIFSCVSSVSDLLTCDTGHLVCGVSYFDFICTGLEVNQMPKKGAFGYDMKHTKMNK